MKKRILFFFVCLGLLMALSVCLPAVAAEEIIILYTNDVHTYIDHDSEEKSGLSYDNIAALKQALLAEGKEVLLVDAGDHIQGAAYGAMDQGQHIVRMMNVAGYDLATMGNHEFDYTMSGLFNAIGSAAYPYISCNFVDLRANAPMLESYRMFERGGRKIAFVGITTPETFTSTAPAYFQDGEGNYIYSVLGGEDGTELYEAVQKAITEAKRAGADYVIALGHLGVDESARPWTSRDVIANTEGLIAFIDGHSHTEMASETVKDKAGNSVLLTQTGSYFSNIGYMTISEDGVSAKLLDSYAGEDAVVEGMIDSWIAEIDATLGEKIADSEIAFDIREEDGTRIVRIKGTNMADFNADAFYYVMNEVEGLQCDVAITNGGGVRSEIAPGDWSYTTLKTVNPFGNVLCLMEITGQQLLDALEWGARLSTGENDSAECGGFLHTAGITYEINTTIASTVSEAEEMWNGRPSGLYRVQNVMFYDRESGSYQPLKLGETYMIGGSNFTLRNGGDGFTMFAEATLVKDYIMEDYLALAAYAKAFADTDDDGYPEITTANSPLAAYEGYQLNYESRYGSGRVTFSEQIPAETGHSMILVAAKAPTEKADGNIEHWYCPYCDRYFSAGENGTEITKEDTVIPKLAPATEESSTAETTGAEVSPDTDDIKQDKPSQDINPWHIVLGVAAFVLLATVFLLMREKKKNE